MHFSLPSRSVNNSLVLCRWSIDVTCHIPTIRCLSQRHHPCPWVSEVIEDSRLSLSAANFNHRWDQSKHTMAAEELLVRNHASGISRVLFRVGVEQWIDQSHSLHQYHEQQHHSEEWSMHHVVDFETGMCLWARRRMSHAYGWFVVLWLLKNRLHRSTLWTSDLPYRSEQNPHLRIKHQSAMEWTNQRYRFRLTSKLPFDARPTTPDPTVRNGIVNLQRMPFLYSRQERTKRTSLNFVPAVKRCSAIRSNSPYAMVFYSSTFRWARPLWTSRVNTLFCWIISGTTCICIAWTRNYYCTSIITSLNNAWRSPVRVNRLCRPFGCWSTGIDRSAWRTCVCTINRSIRNSFSTNNTNRFNCNIDRGNLWIPSPSTNRTMRTSASNWAMSSVRNVNWTVSISISVQRNWRVSSCLPISKRPTRKWGEWYLRNHHWVCVTRFVFLA